MSTYSQQVDAAAHILTDSRNARYAKMRHFEPPGSLHATPGLQSSCILRKNAQPELRPSSDTLSRLSQLSAPVSTNRSMGQHSVPRVIVARTKRRRRLSYHKAELTPAASSYVALSSSSKSIAQPWRSARQHTAIPAQR